MYKLGGAGLAQLVEQSLYTRMVTGSSPVSRTKPSAEVVKSVDTQRSERCHRKVVGVQVSSSAQKCVNLNARPRSLMDKAVLF